MAVSDRSESIKYPENLFLALGIVPENEEALYREQLEGLEYTLRCLTTSERDVIDRYYRLHQSLPQIAKQYGMKSGQIQHIRKMALDRLSHPTRLRIITMGLKNANTYENSLQKLTALKGEIKRLLILRGKILGEIDQAGKGKYRSQFTMGISGESIDQCGFPIRTRNCLHRCGLHTMEDLENYGIENLQNIRGIGNSSIQKIKQIIESYHENQR